MKLSCFKKTTAIIVISALLALCFPCLFYPQQAKAVYPVSDYAVGMNTYILANSLVPKSAQQSVTQGGILTKDTFIAMIKNNEWLMTVGKEAAYQAWMALRKMLLRMLVNDIVRWIQGGGTPRFITDWGKFLETAADKAGGQFVDQYLGMGFLCERFDVRLKIALAAVPTFDESVRCTLSTMGTNIDNFLKNFSNGGWKSWIELNETQNNIYGAYLVSLDKKMSLEAAAAAAAQNEGTASGGFLGDKVCTKLYDTSKPSDVVEAYDEPVAANMMPPGWACSEWSTQTPGTIAADAASQAVTIDIPWLISAKEWREYASAIVDAFVNRVMKEGLALIKTDSYNYSSASQPASASVGNYVSSITESATASNLPDQLKLLKENLVKAETEYQTNLNYLNKIKNLQIAAVNSLEQAIQKGCSLPSGVTVVNTNNQTVSDCSLNCPCATTTITESKITIPDMGEFISRKTATATYKTDAYTSGCAMLESSSSTTALSGNTSADTEISSVNSEIEKIKSQLANIDSTIAELDNYAAATEAYTAAWDADPSIEKNSTSTQTAFADVESTKNNSISMLQDLLETDSTDMEDLLTDAQNYSQELSTKVGAVEQKRGDSISGNCDFASAGSYLSMLCATQTQKTALDASLGSCGGGGSNANEGGA